MAVQTGSLTGDTLKKLSPGACRLLLAYKEEPAASLVQYMALTGYSRRWINKLHRELQQAGVITDGAAAAPVAGESDQAYQALAALGVKPTIARELAQEYTWITIHEGIQYVQHKPGIANRAGYLVKRLRERARESAEAAPVLPPVMAAAEMAPVQAEPVPTDLTVISSPVGETRVTPAGEAHTVEWQMLAYSVTVACGCDLSLNPAAAQAVQRLHVAGYTAEDVGYFLKAYWPTIWPGNSGEPPTLAALLAHIGHAKHLLEMADGRSRGDELLRRITLLREYLAGERQLEHPDDLLPPCEGDPHISPYALSGHPHFADWIATERHTYNTEKAQQRADWQATHCPTCRRAHEHCVCQQIAAIPGRVKDSWLAVLGQLQIQLNRATYDTWLRRLTLVGYSDGELVVEVPDHPTQEWLERHLMQAMIGTLNAIYRRQVSDEAMRIRLCQKAAEPFTLGHLL